ncbi:hypothetical protein SprV_0301280300 [Sparganum proliferum]
MLPPDRPAQTPRRRPPLPSMIQNPGAPPSSATAISITPAATSATTTTITAPTPAIGRNAPDDPSSTILTLTTPKSRD